MRTEDIIITAILYLVMVIIPTFVIYKLKGAVAINAVLFTLLFIWIIPGFSFLPTALYFVFLIFTMSANLNNHKLNNMTEEEKQEREAEINKLIQTEDEKNIISCPNCSSKNVDFIGNERKSFSVGKAAVGSFLTGGIGTLAGFVGKEGKTNKWHCKDCGTTFSK